MIVRPAGSSLLLVTQPDHAALAARLVQPWTADGLPDSPLRQTILRAIEEHDNGWREVDRAPLLDESTGGILDFLNTPEDIRRAVWPRGVTRLAGRPYEAALVAEHALQIYRRFRSAPDWAAFFAAMEAARTEHLRRAGRTRADLTRDYLFLRIGDLVSLTFCNGWTALQEDESGYTVRYDGDRLIVAPDPYAGASFPVEVPARRLANRRYQSAADLEAAFARARPVALSGVVTGA
jgi:hypothetical protein